MPLTRPDNFKAHAPAGGERIDSIVTMSDGIDTWCFSRRPIPGGLDGAQVYPLLLGHADVVDAVDWVGKSLMAGSVSVTLMNTLHYPTDGGAPARISTLLENVSGGELKIYLIAGDAATTLADCLLIFSGYAINAPEYDSEKLTVTALSKGKLFNTKLPLLKVHDKWSSAPVKSLQQVIPIVYGEWNAPDLYGDDVNGTGMFRSVLIDPTPTNLALYLTASHEMNAVNDSYFIIGGEPAAVYFVTDAYSEGQGNYLSVNATISYLDFPLTSTLPGIYDGEVYLADDPTYAHDDDTGTFAVTRDNVSDAGEGMETCGKAAWALADDAAFRKYISATGGFIRAGYRNLQTAIGIEHEDIKNVEMQLLFYYDEHDWPATVGKAYSDENLVFDDTNIKYLPPIGSYLTGSDLGDNWSDKFAVLLTVTTDPDLGSGEGIGDGVVDNQQILKVGELFLRLVFNINTLDEYCWSSGSGKMFGPWIDDEGRSNDFDEGDVIIDPAMIVEDIFRSYFALTNSDIDVESFDTVVNPSVEMRVNINELVDGMSLVRSLCEQSTFAVFYSAAGKLTAVPLNDNDPSVDETIRKDQIINGEISVSKTIDVINKLTVRSRYKEHYNQYFNSDVYEDAYSIAGSRSATYDWKNIVGNSIDEVAGVYVADSTGIWSQQHVQVSLSVSGCAMSHLQSGDYIALDIEVDEICKPYGGTWDGRKLLVIEVRKNIGYTKVTAVELYE